MFLRIECERDGRGNESRIQRRGDLMSEELSNNKLENNESFFLQDNREITSKYVMPTENEAYQNNFVYAYEGEKTQFSNLRVVNVTDVILKDNTANFGSDVMSGETLQIGSNVTMLDGLYLKSRSVIPTITRHLSTDAVIQLEASPYLAPDPSGTPIVVATSSIPLLPQDAAAFRIPTDEAFSGWEIKRSDDMREIWIAPEVYAIAYENTRSEENPNPQNYTVVTPTVVLIDLPNLPAYRFLGWFDAPEGGNRVTEIQKGSIGDRTFYARWDAIVHTITYYGNDEEESKAENLPSPQSVLRGESVILSDESPTRTGFLFLSWNTSSDGTGTTYRPEDVVSNVTADIGLYAQWLSLPPKFFRVCFIPNMRCSCEVCGMPPPMTVREHHSARIPSCKPCSAFCRFIGWNTRADGCGSWYALGQSIVILRNLTLFAQWR